MDHIQTLKIVRCRGDGRTFRNDHSRWPGVRPRTVPSPCEREERDPDREQCPQRPSAPEGATLVYRLHDQRGIRAAKAEAVVEYRTDGPFLGLVRHQVDTFGALARVVEVERRRDDLVAHREDAEDALY